MYKHLQLQSALSRDRWCLWRGQTDGLSSRACPWDLLGDTILRPTPVHNHQRRSNTNKTSTTICLGCFHIFIHLYIIITNTSPDDHSAVFEYSCCALTSGGNVSPARLLPIYFCVEITSHLLPQCLPSWLSLRVCRWVCPLKYVCVSVCVCAGYSSCCGDINPLTVTLWGLASMMTFLTADLYV